MVGLLPSTLISVIKRYRLKATAILSLTLFCLPAFGAVALALTITSSDSLNVTATVVGVPPSEQAVILHPSSGTHLSTTPLVVQGTCGAGLLVRVFDNSQLAGSINCEPNGTFTMNITLDIGDNRLTAKNYDQFDQPGPVSPEVLVVVDKSIPADVDNAVPDNLPSLPIEKNNGPKLNLFQGTVLQPIGQVINATTNVSPEAHAIVAVAVNGLFAVIVVALISLLVI